MLRFEFYLSNTRKKTRTKSKITSIDWMEQWENKACGAFLKLRKNADIFINLLVLMVVGGLEELDL